MAEKIKIEIFRKMSPEELTASLADPESRAQLGSGAALTASVAAAFLERAAAVTAGSAEKTERLEYILRNSETLRNYMVHLIDEDVKCRGPLRKAEKEGDERAIEAARQTAVAINTELVAMMGKLLELLEELCAECADEAKPYAAASADLALGVVNSASRYILHMASLSSDDTYRFVRRREYELTLEQLQAIYDRIVAACGETQQA